jgi:hypothetical protein
MTIWQWAMGQKRIRVVCSERQYNIKRIFKLYFFIEYIIVSFTISDVSLIIKNIYLKNLTYYYNYYYVYQGGFFKGYTGKILLIAGFTQRIPTVSRVTRVGTRFTKKKWSVAVLKNSVSWLPTGTLHVRRSCTSLKRANCEKRSKAEPRYFSFELTSMKAAMTTQGQQQLI